MSIYIHKSHNVTVLLYHVVCVAKYRRVVIDEGVDEEMRKVCIEIAQRYEVHFVEIGTDRDHVHFLIQSVPMYSPTKIVRTVKSLIARELMRRVRGLREKMWGGEFWSDGYYINTVGRQGSENAIQKYIKQQGKVREYSILHKDQLKLF